MDKFDVQIDNYGDITVSMVGVKDNCPKPTYVMNDSFFTCNCKENADKTRSLILNGNKLYSNIGRRFKNWDVPYLSLFLVNNTDVTKLNLANNEIESAGFIGIIGHLLAYKHIQELDVQNNQIRDPGINYMYRNRAELQLKVLRLRGNKIGAQNSQNVALTFVNNHFIRHLDVAETDQNESSLLYFITILRSDMKFNNTIKILDLSRPNPTCPYSKLDTQHIAETIGIALRYNTTLEELHLQKFSFSCHDIEDMFRNAIYNRSLKVLDLCCNNIGDYGMEVISKWFRNCSSLQSLLLGHNIISNHGIRALSETVPFSKVIRLDISYNRFDDNGCIDLFNSILKIPLIRHIKIYGNNIGLLSIQVLKKLFELNIFEQKNIDVKLYTVDGTPYLAYYNGE